MQDLRITLVQADQRWEDKAGNIKHYEDLLLDVSETDLILLPEMFHTGFTMNAVEMAEEMNNSLGLDWLKQLAKNKNSAVYTSLIIREGAAYHNRGVFVFPDGLVEYYDKQKSFGLAGEDKVFTAGNSEKIVKYKGWKLMLQICYDLRFPELVRNKMIQGTPKYDILLYVANWPERRGAHWKTLLKARAIENQCFVAGVNRVGVDGKELKYSGDTVIVDALGNEIFAKESKEHLLSLTLDAQLLNQIRRDLPFLKDQTC
jgi:omega-amidase